jgi:hypothetical protein
MADTDSVMAPATATEDTAMDVSESATATAATDVKEEISEEEKEAASRAVKQGMLYVVSAAMRY